MANVFGANTDLGSGITNPIAGITPNYLNPPWPDKDQAVEAGSFFPPVSIDPSRWNKLFPYRLLVVDVTNNSNTIVGYKQVGNNSGASVSGSSTGTNWNPDDVVGVALKGISNAVQAVGKALSPKSGFSLEFHPTTQQWDFRLPISPQQLQITTPYAISVTPTLKGIVEEHSGVRFKMISCAGTMGILPYKNSVGEQLTGSLGGFFSGTVANATNIATQFNALKRAVAGSDGGVDVGTIPGGFEGTGYAQAMLLDQFLEQYAENKKDPANAGWRLVFDIPKQNQSFVVTPIQFTWSQSVDSPGEIKYSFQLKAWRRIDLYAENQINDPINVLPSITPSVLQRVTKSIAAARGTVAAASSTIQAVNGDVRQVANVIRTVALLTKELSGLPQTAADMSVNLVKELKSSLLQSRSIAASAFPFFNVTTPAATGSTVPVVGGQSLVGNSLGSPFSRSPSDNLRVADQIAGQSYAANEGLSSQAVAGGQLGQNSASLQANDPVNHIFENPDLYPEFFDAIEASSLNLTPTQKNKMNSYFATGSLIDITDLLEAKAYFINLASLLANYYGKGNQTYAYIYKTPPANVTSTPLTIEQFDTLNVFYNLIQSINLLTSTQQIDDGRIQNALGYEAQIAQANGIPFSAAQSKVRAPVPFGLTIEQIAARYLGDPDRWVEIAALNDLQEPYIDENGFIRLLLSNATGRLINVDSGENLYVGQRVTIMAQNLPSTTRKITKIEQISATNYLITLDGNDNLDIYTTAGQARMKAYLSGTVNSQVQIYIPSSDVAPNDLRTRPVPRFAGDNLVGLSKIDWLLDDYSDIALDAYGDFRLAGGLTNLIQALKLKFSQPFAKNLRHPTYGAGIGYGTSTADVEARGLYNQIATAVLSDPRFGSIKRLQINLDGNVLNVNLAVTIANGNGILPINFNINV